MAISIIENLTWKEIRKALRDSSLTIGLFGPPGVGKTEGIIRAGRRAKKPYIGKIQFHSEMSPAEMMGMSLPHESGYVWESGAAELAYVQGGLLILDEIAEASGPCKTYLYGLLDKGLGGTISYVGRTFTQAKGYQVAATMNERPDSGVLPPALLDRFDAWILVSSPSEEQLATLDDDMAALCAAMYESADSKIIGPDLTFRTFQSYQKLRKIWAPDKAALGACRGDVDLANSLIEVLALYNTADPTLLPDSLDDITSDPFSDDDWSDS